LSYEHTVFSQIKMLVSAILISGTCKIKTDGYLSIVELPLDHNTTSKHIIAAAGDGHKKRKHIESNETSSDSLSGSIK